ncbi:hypothetical protein [Algoriphagus sp. Y33]|uniref:hypothetical protein n=1 Tax=Algoriphagus sp. Y33 TaxID=2772483 RepID=UPI001782C46C|nr:hypothetical protein [Algoriphagus sp. Y33]
MKIFLNIVIIVGYLLFGSMWLKSLYEVIFYNSIVNIFEFKDTTTSKVYYLDRAKDDRGLLVKYEFKIGQEVYENSVPVNRKTFEEKVGMSGKHIIHYNRMMPNANYLDNWKVDSYYKFMFAFFSLFLLLIIFFHLKVDKRKWINKYKNVLGVR